MQNGGANFTEYSNVNQFLVSLNGILQSPTDSFTVSGSTITFASNLITGDVIDFIIVLGNSLDVGVPSDNTVSLAKLTATGTKDATTFLRGDNTFAEAGGGKVLQVIAGTHATEVSTTSSSYVTTNITASITPSATSSKILIIANTTGRKETAASNGNYTIFKGASDLDGTGNGFARLRDDAGGLFCNAPIVHLDSPSTTSSTTYTMYMKSSAGSVFSSTSNSPSTIILMEIGS
jgi:hypothetical protein